MGEHLQDAADAIYGKGTPDARVARVEWVETLKAYEDGLERVRQSLRHFSRAVTKERARTAYDRGISAAGSGRQLMALLASPNRTEGLRTVRVPATVIHGTADRLVNRSGGRAVARAIPEAELVEIDGMGHDLPVGAWPQIVDAIVATARRAEAASTTAAPR